jgi:hypothetical protein
MAPGLEGAGLAGRSRSAASSLSTASAVGRPVNIDGITLCGIGVTGTRAAPPIWTGGDSSAIASRGAQSALFHAPASPGSAERSMSAARTSVRRPADSITVCRTLSAIAAQPFLALWQGIRWSARCDRTAVMAAALPAISCSVPCRVQPAMRFRISAGPRATIRSPGARRISWSGFAETSLPGFFSARMATPA